MMLTKMQVTKKTYRWAIPEFTLLTEWAKEDEILYMLNSTVSSEAILRQLKTIHGIESESIFRQIFAIGREDIFLQLSKTRKLVDTVNNSGLSVLITGRKVEMKKNAIEYYTEQILKDLADRHISDVAKVLNKMNIDITITNDNYNFSIELNSHIQSCELENLLYSASRFNCNGIYVQMLLIT